MNFNLILMLLGLVTVAFFVMPLLSTLANYSKGVPKPVKVKGPKGGKSKPVSIKSPHSYRLGIYLQSLLYLPRRIVIALLTFPFDSKNWKEGVCFANVGESVTPFGLTTRKTDAAITTRWLIVKQGTDVDHIAVNAASTTLPLGVCTDEAPAAEEYVAIQLLGSNGNTVRMVASEAIAANEIVYTAANGKIQDTPAGSSGVAFKVGRALQAASADGSVIEVEPCFPVSVTF